jgi:hypothetical protein
MDISLTRAAFRDAIAAQTSAAEGKGKPVSNDGADQRGFDKRYKVSFRI